VSTQLHLNNNNNNKTISKDINMNFGLEKCARMCLKRGRVQSKVKIWNTLENINLLASEFGI
jgi:hypothetical protein